MEEDSALKVDDVTLLSVNWNSDIAQVTAMPIFLYSIVVSAT
jgi:hypothetical protein